jgi:ubiquinone/menaquinone biosynthesis C-methylase UbiE
MSDTARGQVIASAAEVYEELYVPALFQEWAPRMVDAARVAPGQRVLDVACGTGVLTRALGERVGASGHVAGLDVNDGMLAVARRRGPAVAWHRAAAETMPFGDADFDAVLCQFALMFFDARPKALAEMRRVLRPGGRLAVAVWAPLEDAPAYAAVVALLDRMFGPAAGASLRAPFVLGDPAQTVSLVTAAGFSDVRAVTHEGRARFPSLEAWMHADVRGWTAADLIDDGRYARLLDEARRELARFVQPDGTVVFRMPAHIVTASR